ncbi:MAG TPA: hypothetical protein VK361_00190 [Rubrobacteraceae bacterium]|nr:hypothetical protein [Rubrobacteraceae bacterium]
MSVGWLEILERAQRKRSINNALPATDEHSENAGGDGVDKRTKRGDDETPVASVAEVFELARLYFPQRDGLPLLPSVRGRDPLVHRGTDKACFFRDDRRAAGPKR